MNDEIIWIIILGSCLLMIFFVLISIGYLANAHAPYVQKVQGQLNQNMQQYLHNIKFNQTRIFYLNDYATFDQDTSVKKFVSIDTIDRKIAFVDYKKGNLFVVNFFDVLNYEIYENGAIVSSSVGLGMGAGALFFGSTSGLSNELKLIIRLNSYEYPHIVYDIVEPTDFNSGVNKNTQQYRDCITTLQEFISFLEVVRNQNQKTITT